MVQWYTLFGYVYARARDPSTTRLKEDDMPIDIPEIDPYEQKLIRNVLSATAALYYRLRTLNVEHKEADEWMNAINALMQQTESNTIGWGYDDDDDDKIIEINPEQPYGSTIWGLFMEGWHRGRQGCDLTFCGCSNGSILRDEHGVEVIGPYQQEGATDDVDDPESEAQTSP